MDMMRIEYVLFIQENPLVFTEYLRFIVLFIQCISLQQIYKHFTFSLIKDMEYFLPNISP